MKYIFIICSLVVITSINNHLLCFKFPQFNNISSLFKTYKSEKVIEKEYPLLQVDSLRISNTKGDIVIPSEWDQPIVRVKATIKAAKEEDLAHISIDQSQQKNCLVLSTNAPEACSHQVDYELIIPKKINVELITKKGNMAIAEVSGKIQAEVDKGNITIDHSKNNVMAQTISRGNISIHDAQGPLHIHTKKGNITIESAQSNIYAHTENGIVKTVHNVVLHTSIINLESEYGNIIVAFPASTNANLKAKTEHGCITSDHFLTLKSQTTKLDSKSWSRFKKEVHATLLGSPKLASKEASIQLNCKNGTIKLLDNSVTS